VASELSEEPPSAPDPSTASGFQAAKALLAFVPPVTLITALLFYFGWARSYSQARALGADASIFGYSTRDYLLRSVDSLYLPLIVLTGFGLLALLGHQAVAARLRTLTPGRSDLGLVRVGTTLLGIGIAILVYGLAYSAGLLGRNRFVDLTGPLALGIGVMLGAYGGWLRSRARGVARAGAWGQVPSAPWVAPTAAGLLLCVGALSLFWAVGNYAFWRGLDLARVVAETYLDRPGVVVHSSQRLALEGVKETPVGDPGQEAFAYRYSGLRLLDHVANTYFLMPIDWETTHRLILLKDTDDVQVELTYVE
jgi:hypothetical protein